MKMLMTLEQRDGVCLMYVDRKLLPDGGDGGPGGDVVLQACKECVALPIE